MRIATTLCLAAAIVIALARPSDAQGGPHQCEGYLHLLSFHSTPVADEVHYFAVIENHYSDISLRAVLEHKPTVTHGGASFPVLRQMGHVDLQPHQRLTVQFLVLRGPAAAAPPAWNVGVQVRFTCPGAFHRRPRDRWERPGPDRP